MKILVFCAHPDDEVIGLGGTIRKFANAGADIRLVHFSAGAEGYATIEEKSTICATRAAEVEKVCKILGISSYVNYGLLDWSLSVDNSTYRRVIEEIRTFQPDAVFTHFESDYHDHRSVSKVVAEATSTPHWPVPWKPPPSGKMCRFTILKSSASSRKSKWSSISAIPWRINLKQWKFMPRRPEWSAVPIKCWNPVLPCAVNPSVSVTVKHWSATKCAPVKLQI